MDKTVFNNKSIYNEAPVNFILARKHMYASCCDCFSCQLSINHRFNSSAIKFCSEECYPIFLCLEANKERAFDIECQARLISKLLLNIEFKDAEIFYLQREAFGFDLRLTAAISEGHIVRELDEFGDYTYRKGSKICEDIDNFNFVSTYSDTVLDSADHVFTYPRIVKRVETELQQDIFEIPDLFDFAYLTNIHRNGYTVPFCLLWEINENGYSEGLMRKKTTMGDGRTRPCVREYERIPRVKMRQTVGSIDSTTSTAERKE